MSRYEKRDLPPTLNGFVVVVDVVPKPLIDNLSVSTWWRNAIQKQSRAARLLVFFISYHPQSIWLSQFLHLLERNHQLSAPNSSIDFVYITQP